MTTESRDEHATGELRPRKWQVRLHRQEVPDYMMERHGIKISASTLAKLATIGGGPAFSKPCGRPLYALSDLDQWALERIGTPRRSTSEAA